MLGGADEGRFIAKCRGPLRVSSGNVNYAGESRVVRAIAIPILARLVVLGMMYAFSRIVWTAIEPSTLLLVVALAGAIGLVWRRRSNLALLLIWVGVGGLTLCAVLPVGVWLMRPLERRFPAMPDLPEHVDGIILLGGFLNLEQSSALGRPVLDEAAGRIPAFVALARHYPQAALVFTGGAPGLFGSGTTEAAVTRQLFEQLGLASEQNPLRGPQPQHARERRLFTGSGEAGTAPGMDFGHIGSGHAACSRLLSRGRLAGHPLSDGLPYCRRSPVPRIARRSHDRGLGDARMDRAYLLPAAGLDSVAVTGAAAIHRTGRRQMTWTLERVI